MPEPNAEYQCRALLLAMGAGKPMGAVSLRPHARARQHRTLGKPPGQIPSQHQTSGEWQVASGKWHVMRGEMCIVTCEWQDESTCMSICV